VTFYNYWGKAQEGCHLLPYHSLDVAATAIELLKARRLWSIRLQTVLEYDEEKLFSWMGYFAALHDLGKFSDSFQSKVPNVRSSLGNTDPLNADSSVRHDSLGWSLYQSKLFRESNHPEVAKVWMRCATGHHGQPPTGYRGPRRISLKKFFSDKDVEAASAWFYAVGELFDVEFGDGEETLHRRASWWVSGMITIADWVGSNKDWFPYETKKVGVSEYFDRAKAQAKVAVYEAGLQQRETSRNSFSGLFPQYKPTPTQSKVDEVVDANQFFLLVEDTTGSGKTEAALCAAGDNFYFGLPTQATANGLWSRVKGLEGLAGSKSLLHSGRWLIPDAMVEASSWLSDSSRQAMLSKIGVGTIDQAQLAILHSRFQGIRLAALADKTLIVDEVHAYDEYQKSLLTSLLSFQSYIGGSVILLSATLPKATREEFVRAWLKGDAKPDLGDDYPLVTYVREGEISEHPIVSPTSRVVEFVSLNSSEEVLKLIKARSDDGKCVCWIRNTVDDAVSAYDELVELGIDVSLFHARFCVADRRRIEDKVLSIFGKDSSKSEREGKVLVATQVVEQSLDLDFDEMISDLAPIDLVIQRAGRLHRHDRGDRGTPRFHVHAPELDVKTTLDWVDNWNSGTAAVYPDHGLLWKTQKILDNQTYRFPDDSRYLIESVYDGSKMELPETLVEISEKAQAKFKAIGAQGELSTLRLERGYETDGGPTWDDQFAPTRYGVPSIEWVMFDEEGPIAGTTSKSTVSLPIYALDRVTDDKLKPWQAKLVLQKIAPDTWAGKGTKNNGVPVVVRYSAERGVQYEK